MLVRRLEEVSGILKMPLEQVNFVFFMFLNLPLGLVYRVILHPKKVSSSMRLAAGLTWGLVIAWLCFGSDVLHLIVVAAVCYVLTWIADPTAVHRFVFAASLFYLAAAHIYRMVTEYGLNRFDYTGRMMLMTQKVTYIAFSLHDGLGRKEDKLSQEQQQEKIKRVPSVLEYFAYLFHYSMLFAGPVCTFKDYMDFIEGKDIAAHQTKAKEDTKEPSPTRAVIEKLAQAILFGVLFFAMGKRFPILKNADPAFIASSSVWWRVLHAWGTMVCVRFRYYFVFKMAEAGNNIGGLGFNGYDEKGKSLWNRVQAVNPFNVEFCSSVRDIIVNWNTFTMKWLKSTVYERVSSHQALCVFLTSTLWHGFYPTFYLVSMSALLFVQADRAMRHTLRPFEGSVPKTLRPLVTLVGWVIRTNVIIYCTMPFILIRLDLSLQFYRSVYFYGHIWSVLVLVICRFARPNSTNTRKQETVVQNGVITNHSLLKHQGNGYPNNNLKSKNV